MSENVQNWWKMCWTGILNWVNWDFIEWAELGQLGSTGIWSNGLNWDFKLGQLGFYQMGSTGFNWDLMKWAELGLWTGSIGIPSNWLNWVNWVLLGFDQIDWTGILNWSTWPLNWVQLGFYQISWTGIHNLGKLGFSVGYNNFNWFNWVYYFGLIPSMCRHELNWDI